MPDIAVAAILVDTFNNGLDRIDLVGAHDEDFLLALHQDHIAADQAAQAALFEKVVGKVVQVPNFVVFFVSVLIDGQKTLCGVKTEMLVAVVGEVAGVTFIAHDKQLHETEQ